MKKILTVMAMFLMLTGIVWGHEYRNYSASYSNKNEKALKLRETNKEKKQILSKKNIRKNTVYDNEMAFFNFMCYETELKYDLEYQLEKLDRRTEHPIGYLRHKGMRKIIKEHFKEIREIKKELFLETIKELEDLREKAFWPQAKYDRWKKENNK